MTSVPVGFTLDSSQQNISRSKGVLQVRNDGYKVRSGTRKKHHVARREPIPSARISVHVIFDVQCAYSCLQHEQHELCVFWKPVMGYILGCFEKQEQTFKSKRERN